MTWTDATNYSKSQPERKQTAWELNTERIRIYITNNHRDYPGKWILVCHNIGITSSIMKIPADATPEMAQTRAVETVKYMLRKMTESLESEA